VGALIQRWLRDVAQLSKQGAARAILSYFYLLVIAALVVGINVVSRSRTQSHPDNFGLVLYLLVVEVVLARSVVRLDRGRLSLTALAIGPASLLLNPLDATLVGLMLGVTIVGGGRWGILGNAVLSAACASAGSALGLGLFGSNFDSIVARVVVLVIVWVVSWILLATSFSVRAGESVASVIRHNFTGSFYIAYAYFTLGSLLLGYLLDGSPAGYLMATIVFVLAFALTDTIAGRRMNRVLESELSDADRHLFHSRAVEGVVHNLRNHMATAVGYLREIDTKRLDPVERDAIDTAKSAANDAVTVLHSLSQGATPRVTFSVEPIDLNELVSRALDMARPRARPKHIEFGLHETADDVKVKADPLLLREVATNLVNNAIDAAPENGRVELSTGRRNGLPYFSVVDNGHGVADDNRHHLFEPHFTTKEHGTGLGLFMSYGIVREHQGQLLFEGNSRGAVFTVVLPPYRH